MYSCLIIEGSFCGDSSNSYTWLHVDADLLPFDSPTTSIGLSPSVENIQQISNVIIPSDNKIIYYSFEDVPSIPDKQIPVNALKKAIESWEVINPNLEFIQSENSNIEIRGKFMRPQLILELQHVVLCYLEF